MSDYRTMTNEIWRAIRVTIEDRNLQELARLCTQFEEVIVYNFEHWRRVPEEIRSDRIQREAYAHSLVTLAKVFQSAGKPALYESLQTEEPDNPIHQADADLQTATRLINQKDYPNAIDYLTGVLKKYQKLLGSRVDDYSASIHGLLGVAYSKNGQLTEAILSTETALTLCERLGDQAGINYFNDQLKKMKESQE